MVTAESIQTLFKDALMKIIFEWANGKADLPTGKDSLSRGDVTMQLRKLPKTIMQYRHGNRVRSNLRVAGHAVYVTFSGQEYYLGHLADLTLEVQALLLAKCLEDDPASDSQLVKKLRRLQYQQSSMDKWRKRFFTAASEEIMPTLEQLG